jgi:hypothetical protein
MSTYQADHSLDLSHSRSVTALISLIVGLGPVLSVLFVASQAGSHWLPGIALGPVLAALVLVWSPLPISIPALIMQDARDAALAQYRGAIGNTVRAAKLIGHLMTSPTSPIRTEMVASVIGWAIAAVVAVHIG